MKLTPEERLRRRRAWRSLYDKKRKETHKEEYQEIRRRYYQRHRDEILAKAAAKRQADNGATLTAWRQRRQQQQSQRSKPGHCDICGDDKHRIVFDHCHQRGVFRGWICNQCNIALGCVRDDPNILRKLIAYLERTKNLILPQGTLPGV